MKTIKRYYSAKTAAYPASTQSNNNSPKGSINNPYTQEEFESFEDGTWPGGWVEGMGYVIPQVNIDGSRGSSSDPYSSGSDPSDPWGSLSSDPWASDGSNPNGNNPGGGGGGNSGGTGRPGTSGGTGSANQSNKYPQISESYRRVSPTYGLTENLGIQGFFNYEYTIKITGNSIYVYVDVLDADLHKDKLFSGEVSVYKDGTLFGSAYLAKPTGDYMYQQGTIPVGSCIQELPKTGKIKVKLWLSYTINTGSGYYAAMPFQIEIYSF